MLVKTYDGSYFTPNEYCTYEKHNDVDGTIYYEVVIVCGQGAGFRKKISEEDMREILKKQVKDNNEKSVWR